MRGGEGEGGVDEDDLDDEEDLAQQ